MLVKQLGEACWTAHSFLPSLCPLIFEFSHYSLISGSYDSGLHQISNPVVKVRADPYVSAYVVLVLEPEEGTDILLHQVSHVVLLYIMQFSF